MSATSIKKYEVGTPEKYTAFEVDNINLYNLHRHCEFKQAIMEEIGEIKWYDKKKNERIVKKRACAYQFTEHNKKIAYFPVVMTIVSEKDRTGTTNNYLHINDVLVAYAEMRKSGKISEDELTIIPVNQGTVDQPYFNTIAIKGSRAYIIDPHSRKSRILSKYSMASISSVVKKTLRALYQGNSAEVSVNTIFTGQQSNSGNRTGGEYQINHTREFITVDNFADEKKVAAAMTKPSFTAENKDNLKIKFMKLFFEMQKKIRYYAAHDPYRYDALAIIANEEVKVTNLHKEIYDNVNLHDLPPGEILRTENKNVLTNKTVKQQFYQAIDALKKMYPVKTAKSAGKFFNSAHTRGGTNEWLINTLKLLKNANPNSNANRDKAVSLLYNYYQSLFDKESQMAESLKQALAILLNIELDYAVIQHKKSSLFPLKEYNIKFENLVEDTIKKNYPGVVALYRSDESKAKTRLIYKLFRYIDDHETSFKYKVAGKEHKQKMDKKMEFARQQITKLSNGEQLDTMNQLREPLRTIIATSTLADMLWPRASAPISSRSHK